MSSSATTIEFSNLENIKAYGFVINGVDYEDYSGEVVSAAGDVNGDGIGDVIISAESADPNGNWDVGSSYVVFGTDSTETIELSTLEAEGGGGFVINGVDGGDSNNQYSVSAAGDLNGDGLDDVFVGACEADPIGKGNDAGSSYVVFGTSDTSAIELEDIEASAGNGFVINGVDLFDHSGVSVSGAGDVNGDGKDDLIIGAMGGNNGAGTSYVVFGTDSISDIDLSTLEEEGGGGFVINGAESSDWSGFSVSGAGDVNGDGKDDLIIGAKYASPNGYESGSSYVVFGTDSTDAIELSTLEEEGGGGFVINGIHPGQQIGEKVSGAGDVNGDGKDDVIIAGNAADPNMGASGTFYVVFGTDSTDAIELSTLEEGSGGFVINGDVNDNSGKSVSGAGDVNGDGKDDVIIGLPEKNTNGSSSGSSYVVFGTDSTDAIELSTLEEGVGGFVINGADAQDASGVSVSGAGDLNGDGLDDVIIGAYKADPNGYESGSSYVVFGTDSTDAIELSDIESGAFKTISTIVGEGYISSGNDLTLTGSSKINVRGDSASNTLTGNSAANILDGGEGDDRLKGGDGNDKLIGGNGNDTLAGGKGNDKLIGGSGRDTAVFSSKSNVIKLFTKKTQNTKDGKDTLIGIENVSAGSGKDKVYGNKGSNILDGAIGNDLLDGGKGDDTLIGGKGKDTLIGGKGKDIFKLSKGKGYDLIQDFKNKQDKIFIGSMKKLKLKNKGNDVYIYKGKDLLAKVKGVAEELSKQGKYLV